MASLLQTHYPWTQQPLIVSAPMRLIAKAELAVAVTKAQGLGFIAGGTDTSILEAELQKAAQLLGYTSDAASDRFDAKQQSQSKASTTQIDLPVGIGLINWGADLEPVLRALRRYSPAAMWFFAPATIAELVEPSEAVRRVSPRTRIWVQVGTVAEAVEVTKLVRPDVLVVQGGDAGGHGLNSSASVVALVPEVLDALAKLVATGAVQQQPIVVAAGGIADGRGVAAVLALGAEGAVLGTRYLASPEAEIATGYRNAVLASEDGGPNTVRSGVYDKLRGTLGWPERYGGRGIINASYRDALAGMPDEENLKQYGEALKLGNQGWGPTGRLATYAGTAVGLVREVKGAGEITKEVRAGCVSVLQSLRQKIP